MENQQPAAADSVAPLSEEAEPPAGRSSAGTRESAFPPPLEDSWRDLWSSRKLIQRDEAMHAAYGRLRKDYKALLENYDEANDRHQNARDRSSWSGESVIPGTFSLAFDHDSLQLIETAPSDRYFVAAFRFFPIGASHSIETAERIARYFEEEFLVDPIASAAAPMAVSRTGLYECCTIGSVAPAVAGADVPRLIEKQFEHLVADEELRNQLRFDAGYTVVEKAGGGDPQVPKLRMAMRRAFISLNGLANSAGFNGKAQLRSFSEQARIVDKLAKFRKTFSDGRIVLMYQPKVDIINNQVAVGAEALARLRVDQEGRLLYYAVGDMIHHAYHHDPAWYQQLSHKLLRQFLDDARAYRELCGERAQRCRLSFNVGAHDIAYSPFVETLMTMPEEYCGLITLEVLENHADPRALKDFVVKMKGRGIKISIDDYFTGAASFQRLLELEVDEIKIDQKISFSAMADRRMRPNLRAQIEGVLRHVDTSQKINGREIMVCAEGVEHVDVQHWYADIPVSVAQGFLYAHALPLKLFAERVNTGKPFTGDADPELLPYKLIGPFPWAAMSA